MPYCLLSSAIYSNESVRKTLSHALPGCLQLMVLMVIRLRSGVHFHITVVCADKLFLVGGPGYAGKLENKPVHVSGGRAKYIECSGCHDAEEKPFFIVAGNKKHQYRHQGSGDQAIDNPCFFCIRGIFLVGSVCHYSSPAHINVVPVKSVKRQPVESLLVQNICLTEACFFPRLYLPLARSGRL